MQRTLAVLFVSVALLAIPASHVLGGKAHVPPSNAYVPLARVHVPLFKAHVPLGKVQVCHKGQTITVSENALPAHHRHDDCQLPACDFNNVFQTGDACTSNNAGGECTGLATRDDAGGITDACPVGTF